LGYALDRPGNKDKLISAEEIEGYNLENGLLKKEYTFKCPSS
jgi:hypothetical protein